MRYNNVRKLNRGPHVKYPERLKRSQIGLQLYVRVLLLHVTWLLVMSHLRSIVRKRRVA